MPYTTDKANAQADQAHERAYPGHIAQLHATATRHTPEPCDAVQGCACVVCNHRRRMDGKRPWTWHGVIRTRQLRGEMLR